MLPESAMRFCAVAATLAVLWLLHERCPDARRRAVPFAAVLPSAAPAAAREAPPADATPPPPRERPSPLDPCGAAEPETEARTPPVPLRITGFVVDDAGEPLHGAEVLCCDRNRFGFLRPLATTSTLRGRFALAVVPEKDPVLVVSAPRHAPREWRPRNARERTCADVRFVLPRRATLTVTTVLPTGCAATGARVQLSTAGEIVTSRTADAEGRVTFWLDPDRKGTLSALGRDGSGSLRFVCRPVPLRGRVAAGDCAEMVLHLEEMRRTTLEVVVTGATDGLRIDVEGYPLVLERGIARHDVETGSYRIRLKDRSGSIVATRRVWVPSDASFQRELMAAP